jgi:hypothetical protein
MAALELPDFFKGSCQPVRASVSGLIPRLGKLVWSRADALMSWLALDRVRFS